MMSAMKGFRDECERQFQAKVAEIGELQSRLSSCQLELTEALETIRVLREVGDQLGGVVEIPLLNPIEKCGFAACARTKGHKGQHMDSGELANYRAPE